MNINAPALLPKKIKLVYLIEDETNSPYQGAPGLSVYLEAHYDDKKLAIIMDAGSSEEVLEYNLNLLTSEKIIDLEKVIGLTLSHGHWDHGDGFPALLRRLKKHIPLVVHPLAITKRISIVPYIRRVGLKFSESDLEKMGAYVIKVDHSLELIPGVYFSGEIPRVYPPVIDGVYYIQKSNGTLVEDNIIDDTALFALGAETVLIVSGCGHSGILNIVKYAKEFFNSEKRFAKRIFITGGFHLKKRFKRDLEEIANILLNNILTFEEVYIAPCHCTGNLFMDVLENIAKESSLNIHILRPKAGTEIIITHDNVVVKRD